MRVILKLDLTDDQLRSIRAGDGRGGRATRKEAATFAEGWVRAGLSKLPPPKRRRPKGTVVEKRASLRATGAETVDEVRAATARIAALYGRGR